MLHQSTEEDDNVELSPSTAITPLRDAQLSKQQAYQLIDLYVEINHVLDNQPKYLPMHQRYKKLVVNALKAIKGLLEEKSTDFNAINAALDKYHLEFIKGVACGAQMGHLNLMSMPVVPVTRIPDCLFMDPMLTKYFKNLSHFSIQNAKLFFISDRLFSCPKLSSVFIFDCNLRALPEGIGNAKLTTLNVTRNQLKELPKSIVRLNTLNKLILRENQISDIPEQIGSFKHLCILDLSDNHLRDLPRSFNTLKLKPILTKPIYYGAPKTIANPQVYLNNNRLSTIPNIFWEYLCNNKGVYISLIECKICQHSQWHQNKSPSPPSNNSQTNEKKCTIM